MVTHNKFSTADLHMVSDTRLVEGAQPKINDLQLIIEIYQNVLGLQVPVCNPITMKILHCRDDLLEEAAGLILCYSNS